MSERVEIGQAVLYHGDCREVLVTVPNVDTVIADPPYSIINDFGVQNYSDGSVRKLTFAFDQRPATEIVPLIGQALALAQSFFVFCGVSQISHIESAGIALGFTVKPAVWVKDCPPPALPGNWWPSGAEYALYGYKSGAWFGDKNPKRCNVFRGDTYRFGIRASEKVDHPTQKWLPLMQHLVQSLVAPDAVCLDPFMGSGTTGVACAQLGRKFIGIEIDRRYFDIACKRIEQAYAQGRLFEPQAAPQPEQLGMQLQVQE